MIISRFFKTFHFGAKNRAPTENPAPTLEKEPTAGDELLHCGVGAFTSIHPEFALSD
jgi:hypothetical protein